MLPKISDPDNDPFYLTLNLQNSLTFAQYSSSKLSFSPTEIDLSQTSYQIKIVIKDLNPGFQKMSTYILLVTVTSLPNIGSTVKDQDSQAPSNATTFNATAVINNSSMNTRNISGQMRITKISKTGIVTLSILCSNYGDLLVNQIDNNMLNVYLKEETIKQSIPVNFNISSKNPAIQ